MDHGYWIRLADHIWKCSGCGCIIECTWEDLPFYCPECIREMEV